MAFTILFGSWTGFQGGYDRIFSLPVTLWYMVYQRLHADHCMHEVVKDIHNGGADSLGDPMRKPLSQRIISWATTAYSNSRQRLSLANIADALQQLMNHTSLTNDNLWHGFRVLYVDGSTFRMRPLGNILKVFAPHSNQHGKDPKNRYWCLCRVVGCFCAHTGMLLHCKIGTLSTCETTLVCRLILQNTAKNLLYIGDRAFGIFRVIQAARQAGASILVRMTDVRAFKLAGKTIMNPGSYSVSWTPSRHDQCLPGCSHEPIQGRLLMARLTRDGYRDLVLYLFTTLVDQSLYSDADLVALYGGRWKVELNFRYLKSQMNMDRFYCQSARMAIKEWMAGLLAYNLIRRVMFQAASLKGFSPDRLSFSDCRRVFRAWLGKFGSMESRSCLSIQQLLSDVALNQLPKRKNPRPSEPRLKRHLRETFPPLKGSRANARLKIVQDFMKN